MTSNLTSYTQSERNRDPETSTDLVQYPSWWGINIHVRLWTHSHLPYARYAVRASEPPYAGEVLSVALISSGCMQ